MKKGSPFRIELLRSQYGEALSFSNDYGESGYRIGPKITPARVVKTYFVDKDTAIEIRRMINVGLRRLKIESRAAEI